MMTSTLRTFEGGPSLQRQDLSSFEQTHEIALPASYKEFLLATNGGRPERDLVTIPGGKDHSPARIHLFFGLGDPVESCNLDWNIEVFSDRIDANLLPIGTTEGADKICLSVAGEHAGAVFYWDGYAPAGQRNLYFLAKDFESFVSSLQADELSPTPRG